MEYPTITLITKPDATSDDLESVLAHEVGHNWLAIMLASNERKYAWLDEGINTYYQFRYEAEVNKTNTVFGASLPAELKQKPTREFQALIYNALNKIPLEGAIDIPSADFADKDAYGMITYLKTAIWMYYIELNVGKENLDRAMKAFFNQWKFKHPQPQDLKAVMEKELRMNMTPYFELLNKKANF
jgi:aminopeptidase N